MLCVWGGVVNIYSRMSTLVPGEDSGQAQFTWTEVFVVLWQKRKLIGASAAALLCVGTAYSLLRTPQYTVKSVVEIGSLPFDNSPAPVETPDTTINKIKQVYAEAAAQQSPIVQKDFGTSVPVTIARPVRNTNAIVIEHTSDGRHSDALVAFQSKIAELLRADHDKLFRVAMADLESQRNQAWLEIERLKDPASLEAEIRPIAANISKVQYDILALRADGSNSPGAIAQNNAIAAAKNKLEDIKEDDDMFQQSLQQKDALAEQLKSQIAHMTAYMEQARTGRDTVAASLPKAKDQTSEDRSTMMSLLSFDADLSRKAVERGSLEQTLKVTLPLERAKIASDRATNQRLIGNQENVILKLTADRRALDLDRAQKATVLEQSLPGLNAKLADAEKNRSRLIVVQEAKIKDITTTLSDVTGTRLLVPPRREDVRAEVPAEAIILLTGLLGLIAGSLAALAMAFAEKFKIPMSTRAGVPAAQPQPPAARRPEPAGQGMMLPIKRGPRDTLSPLLASFQVRPMPQRKLNVPRSPR